VVRGDICPKCKKQDLHFTRGIEVGHTFKLGTKYSKAMNATFLDKEGKQQYFIMGCYGIGVSRIVAAVIEQSHDENGIIWPKNLAPFDVIILPIDYNDKSIKETADKIYKELLTSSIDVLLDDRDERPGVKFKDADLIGIPIRIIVTQRYLPDQVEIKYRTEPKGRPVNISEVKRIIHT
ncbi:MAG: His/Gly/Thr/Pro-type tRNA ligase C-terminal domain-containing protein, partial [Endomicrobiia bacterium]